MDDFGSSSSSDDDEAQQQQQHIQSGEGDDNAASSSSVAVLLPSEISLVSYVGKDDTAAAAAAASREREREARKPPIPIKKRSAEEKRALFDRNLANWGALWKKECVWYDPAEVGRLMRDGMVIPLPSGEHVRVAAPVSHNIITSAHLGLFNIDLIPIVEQASNVEYDRKFASQFVTMRLKHPSITAHIFQTGTITTMGSKDEYSARVGVRMLARKLQRLHLKILLSDFQIRSVLLVAKLGFGVALDRLAREPELAQQNLNVELHQYVEYKTDNPALEAKVYHSGKVFFRAGSRDAVHDAYRFLYPMCLAAKLSGVPSHGASTGLKRKSEALDARPRSDGDNDDDDEDERASEDNFDQGIL